MYFESMVAITLLSSRPFYLLQQFNIFWSTICKMIPYRSYSLYHLNLTNSGGSNCIYYALSSLKDNCMPFALEFTIIQFLKNTAIDIIWY